MECGKRLDTVGALTTVVHKPVINRCPSRKRNHTRVKRTIDLVDPAALHSPSTLGNFWTPLDYTNSRSDGQKNAHDSGCFLQQNVFLSDFIIGTAAHSKK